MAKKQWKANVALLEKVERKLRRLRHKGHFYMPSFARETECGTSACIGGHALMIEGYKPDFTQDLEILFRSPTGEWVESWNASQRLLGLTREEAHRLFLYANWPDVFRSHRSLEVDPKVAADRIRHFIQSEGKE